jgi:hypothetical protein
LVLNSKLAPTRDEMLVLIDTRIALAKQDKIGPEYEKSLKEALEALKKAPDVETAIEHLKATQNMSDAALAMLKTRQAVQQ